jgi:hypothetical protein
MTKRTKAAPDGEVRVESDDWPTFFTMVPEWVTFAQISDRAHRIYTVLAAHLRKEGDSRVTSVITQADLAAVVGLSSNPERIRKPVQELETLGAVRVIEEWDPVRKMPLTRYVVRFNPPPGYAGHVRVQSWQQERQAARMVRIEERRKAEERRKGSKTAGQSVTLNFEGHEPRKSEGHVTLKNAGRSPYVTPSDETASDGTDAPSARSAGNARRATTGSARASESGSAASGKAGSISAGKKMKQPTGGGKARMSPAQAAAVREIEAAFPAELSAALPQYRPRVLKLALLDALAFRTPEQIAARVARRWWTYGYLSDATDGGRGIDSPVGVAVTLLRATACPEPMCEDGVTIDTGLACRVCEQRRADRRAAKAQGADVPAQRGPAAERPQWWECTDCGAPSKDAPSEDGVCLLCRRTAESVAQRLAEHWDQVEQERLAVEAAGWLEMLEDAHAEHAEREQAVDRHVQVELERERQRLADEQETRRLREELARQYPELAAASQHATTGVAAGQSPLPPF